MVEKNQVRKEGEEQVVDLQQQSISLEQQVAEATPFERVHLLMSGAIEKMGLAREALLNQNWLAMEEQLQKTVKIVEYLRLSLDKEIGQEFAQELDELYFYTLQQLALAKQQRRSVLIEMARNVMGQIAAVWKNGMEQWALVEDQGGMIPHTLLCHIKPVVDH